MRLDVWELIGGDAMTITLNKVPLDRSQEEYQQCWYINGSQVPYPRQ